MSEGRLDVLVVREDERTKKSYWTKIGAAFPAKEGVGYTVVLDALPLNGRLILRPPKAREEWGA